MLRLEIKKPRQFISPLLSKKPVTATEIDRFNDATQQYLTELEAQRIAKQSEPNIVSNALKPYFENLDYVAQSYSQKGQSGMDLALMLEHSPSVIIEAKVYESSAMIAKSDINKKALHEAILYFMRERHNGNKTLYHIVITDFYNWFVFDAKDFETLFWKNKSIKKIFDSVKDPSVLGSRTEDFYEMVSKHIADMKENLIDDKVIECAYFDLREKRSDKQNIALYKLLSKDALLKTFNPNDANTLNKAFYAELLYLLGLEEVKSGGKKLIQRAKARHSGALYENITQKLIQYGKPTDFESVIRLMIIWINRILFLKLLESQLIKWNGSDAYAFLNKDKIKDFDQLETLFFDILAKRPHDRGNKEFDYVPYLNSSLFEPHAFEQKFLTIATLQDDCSMPYYAKTVLKDAHAKRKEREVNMLHYLFEFLDAYDFASEGSEEVVSESKSLINASVLGLIFEKLNGYKDGSFYTPSFITMYMSKETITKAIVEKFNQIKGWSCTTLDELDDKIEDKKEANDIIDSLTICDPAVGSGHFLVSSLNTILEIKSQLRILFDGSGKRIKDYELSVENDELIVRDDEGEIFEYKRKSKEATRIQQMLFTQKQKIIENALFGVDINPNSAQITRLRLWIELLKNSYYDEGGHLVTMPNIDINIKVGNSLISRYGLEDEIDIPNIKHAIERYKASVKDYKEGNFLSTKEEIRSAIDDVKGMFGLTLKAQWTQTENYKKALGKYVKEYGMDGLKRDMQLDALEFNYGYHGNLFEEELSTAKKKEKAKLLDKVTKAYQAIEEIEKGKIYEDAFEWRFEFPEVLDEEGNFVGFDVVIGNPPYGASLEDKVKTFYKTLYENVHMRTIDTFNYFISMSSKLLSKDAHLSFIIPNNLLYQNEYEKTRALLLNSFTIQTAINLGDDVFEDASVPTCIVTYQNITSKSYEFNYVDIREEEDKVKIFESLVFEKYNKESMLEIPAYTFGINPATAKLIQKVKNKSYLIDDIALEVASGISTGGDKIFRLSENEIYDKELESELLERVLVGREINRYELKDTHHGLIYTTRDTDIEAYPNIFEYLRPFEEKLMSRSESKKGILPWYSLNRQRYTELFIEDKILLRQTADSVIATFDNEKYFAIDSILIFKINPKFNINYLYATAILNAKLTTFIYKNYTGEEGRQFAQVKPKNIRKLFIPKITMEEQKPFVEIANQIITLKKQNQDTSELEAQIDQMVYELYGLSEEEIAVVEGK